MSLFFLILGFLIKMGASVPKSHLRLYGGVDDLYEQFSFTVALHFLQPNRYRFCSGSLLDANWVLTSAQCIDAGRATNMGVRFGDFTVPDTNKWVKVFKLYPHPNFNNVHGINDIGLMFVDKILGRGHVKLMAADYKTLFGLPVTFAGFGRTSESLVPWSQYEIIQEQLIPIQVGHGVVVPCDSQEAFQYSTLCVAPKCSQRMQEARSGDAGGPLLYDGKVIGVQRSFHPATYLSITQYTPVSSHTNWVKIVMESMAVNTTTR